MMIREMDAYLFDVDGTLYPQKKVRLAMFRKMLLFLMRKPQQYKNILCVFYFRRYRETEKYKSMSISETLSCVAKKIGISENEAEKIIQYWMFEEPLVYLQKYKYAKVIEFINGMYDVNKLIYIYSDYPVKDKLDAMSVHYSKAFVSGEEGLTELKPSKMAAEYIMSNVSVSKEQILYVGDRDEKDRASAEMMGVHYLDIQDFMKSL